MIEEEQINPGGLPRIEAEICAGGVNGGADGGGLAKLFH
jgi:hypothetical protein